MGSNSSSGKLVAIVGNSGVGKSTLVQALGRLAPFAVGLEQHQERPFQALMKADPRRYALPNQIDYLLVRAEQERAMRQSARLGLVDGGLELDFYGFTHLFHHKGYLDEAEFAICHRLYAQLRAGLGPPDLLVRLVAPPDVIAQRYAQRGRPLEIADLADLVLLGTLIDSWLDGLPPADVLTIDVSGNELLTPEALDATLRQIYARLGEPHMDEGH